MCEGFQEFADDGEAELLPEPHRALIAGDHEVELHSAKAARLRLFERMRRHCARDAAAHRSRRDDVAAIGDMSAAAAIIGSQIISSDYLAVLFRDEHGVARATPIGERIGMRNIAWDRIG